MHRGAQEKHMLDEGPGWPRQIVARSRAKADLDLRINALQKVAKHLGVAISAIEALENQNALGPPPTTGSPSHGGFMAA